MEIINVEDVYKITGIPTYTYVEPKEYSSLFVAIRSKGRNIVVEGPSGIGKTTAINKALSELGITECPFYSARKMNNLLEIQKIADGNFTGTVIIDDFHRLNSETKEKISDTMKLIADSSEEDKKIIVIGINKVGDSLIKFSPDLNNRIATIRFESNDEERIMELIKKGEETLNIKFDKIDDLLKHSMGSFHITQIMCQKACIQQRVYSSSTVSKTVHVSYPNILAEMSEEFARSFFDIAREFSTGTRLRREGRAPYLHVLKWLSECNEWTLNLTSEIQLHPDQKAGVTQIVEKGFLSTFLSKHPNCSEYIHYDQDSRTLSVEDPKFMFYIKTINWNKFARNIGYISLMERSKYDYALSFAGEDREIVKKVFLRLQSREISVFYDENEQADILSEDVEEYLFPIYESEASFVIVFLSKSYPKKIWTRFESNTFKKRFGDNCVIPIWFDDCNDSVFDRSKEYGGITFYTNSNIDNQVDNIVNLLVKKIETYRESFEM